MTPIELNLDSTVLGRSGCIKNLVQTIIGSVESPTEGGFSHPNLSVNLVYGIGVHKFLDLMYRTKGDYKIASDEAVKLFDKIPKIEDKKRPWLMSSIHLRTTCHMVWSSYVEEDATFEVIALGDKPATEQTFSFIYYEDQYVKINLCGTIDTVGRFKNGPYAIRDWKTTSANDEGYYFTQYEMSRQLRIYTIACKIMAQRYPDSILGKIGATHMGAFIDAIFLSKNPNDTTFARSDVFQYKQKQLDDFQLTLDGVCKRVSEAVKTGYIPKEGLVAGLCERSFGDNKSAKCDFWVPCKLDGEVESVILRRDFIRKPFNPLAYNS